MGGKMPVKRTGSSGLALSLTIVMVLCVSGCASDQPKPAPVITPDHVRSHSDNAFQKLKQEERDAAGDRTAPR
jgi:hypothetical protein